MIQRRTVTSTQLVQAMLDRINVLNPKINCYITVMGKGALEQAAQMDAEAKAGHFRGPLHGVPIALKDNIDTAARAPRPPVPCSKTAYPRKMLTSLCV